MDQPVVLITGSLSNNGRATALAFAAKGARIVVSGRREADGRALALELEKLGSEAVFVEVDVRKEDEVRSLIDQTIARFGRLDIAVNNASTGGVPGLVCEQTAASYAATFETNVLGTLLSLKHEIRALRSQGSGCIVNVSSVCGQEGAPGAALYAASKQAIEGLTRSIALEVAAAGIRINAIARRSIGGGTLPHPDEAIKFARAILFLSSDEANYVNGRVLNIDRGNAGGNQFDIQRTAVVGVGRHRASHRRQFDSIGYARNEQLSPNV